MQKCNATWLKDLRNAFKLTELYLYGNKYAKIEEATFKHMSDLRKLILQRNEIHSLEANVFGDLLETLDLSMNELTCIGNDTFKHLSRLRILKLKENRIRAIEPNGFAGLDNLVELYLSANELPCLQANTFRHLSQLRT